MLSRGEAGKQYLETFSMLNSTSVSLVKVWDVKYPVRLVAHSWMTDKTVLDLDK